VPVVGVANEPAWGLYNNMFTFSYLPGKDGGVDTWGRYAKQQGGTRAMVIYLGGSDQSRTLAQVFARSMQAAGIEVISKVEVEPDVTDVARLARQFAAEHADILIGSVTDDDFTGLVRDIQASGAHLRAAISPNGYGPTTAAGPRWPPGSSVFLYYRPFEPGGPTHERFLAALTKYSPQTPEHSRAGALDGWLAADIFIRGLQETGPCPTRAAFIEKLREVKGYDADGLLVKPIDFARDFGRTNNCFSFVQLDPSGTRWNPVDPLPLCGEYLSTP
jgi:branched-chain amino acid transport system substrate-binding protein